LGQTVLVVVPPVEDVPLVGRVAELQALHRGLLAGTGALLVGSAGTGKSRLAQALLQLAADSGRGTATVRATEASAALRLGAFAPLVSDAVARAGSEVELLLGAADAVGAAVGPEGVLVVDDVHLLDDVSLALVQHLAAGDDVVVIATARSATPGFEPVAGVTALWKDGLLARIEIGALDEATTEAMAEALLCGPLDGASGRRLFELSLGNPLYVRELVLGAMDDGGLRATSGVWRLAEDFHASSRLHELLALRTGSLPDAERDALDLLAIAGWLPLDLLTRLVDDDSVDALAGRGLLTVATEATSPVARLVHPLYGEGLRSQLGPVADRKLRRRLADALEAEGADDDESVLRLAMWRLDGGGHVAPETMVRAAVLAQRRYDEALALRLAEAARAVGRFPRADQVAGAALVALGRHAESEQPLLEAIDHAPDDHQRGLAASQLGAALFMVLARPDDALEVLEKAKASIVDEAWLAELDAQIANIDGLRGRVREALARVAPSLHAEDPRVLIAASVAAGPSLTVAGRAADALELADRAMAGPTPAGQRDTLADIFVQRCSKAFALGELGRLAEAEELATGSYQAAAGVGSVSGMAWGSMLLGRTALLRGHLRTASAAFNEGAALFADANETGIVRWCLAGVSLTAAWRGRVEEAEAALVALDAVGPTEVRMMDIEIERARAWSAAAAGDETGARQQLLDAALTQAELGAHGMSLAALHDLARLDGGKDALDAVTDAHRSVQGQLAAARLRAIEAAAGGQATELADAGDAFVRLGSDLYAAESFAAAAAASRRAGSPRQADRWDAAAARAAERCEGAATVLLRSRGPATSLTRREREVAALAAAGRSNREIAQTLGVSLRTAENHLQRAYLKLGVSRRDELGTALGE
jgi:DNA-binding CsgD family transcriptional regulator